MFCKTSGSFRDFSVFCAFLVLFNSLVQSGYGQQGAAASGGQRYPQPQQLRPAAQTPSTRNPTAQNRTAQLVNAPVSNAQAVAQSVLSALPSMQSAMQLKSPVASLPASAVPPIARDPNFSPSGFRLHPQKQSGSSGASPMRPVPKPAKPIGKAVRPLQLNGPDDPTDPYIIAEAQTLGNNPTQIFNFLRNSIGYEAYAGSLRGARGTLWSGAGNALDRSSLLVALLRASGYTAQYVKGKLSPERAQQEILSIFQARPRVFGCLPAGSTTSDPANDPALLAIAENHFWVQYSSGATGPLTDLDPAFPTSQPGQTFGTSPTTMTAVPPDLQHFISFELDAEMYSQASQAFAQDGFSTSAVIYQSFVTADLVGKPVSFGQYVNSSGFSLGIGATTNNYSPYLLIGEDPTNPDNDDIITGTPVQEILTNFPLGSTVLTGLFAKITITDASGNTTVYNKTLYDAIGIVARNSSGSVSVTSNPAQAPSLSPVDFATFNVIPSRQDQTILHQWSTVSDSMTAQLQAIVAQLPTDPNATLTPAQTALQSQSDNLAGNLVVNSQRGLTGDFASLSDNSSIALADLQVVNQYADSPRLIVATSFAQSTASGGESLTIGFDLLKDDVQVVLPPGQSTVAAISYRMERGIYESYLEGRVLSQFMAANNASGNASIVVPVSAADILTAAQQQGIPYVLIGSSMIGQLNALNISAQARVRIAQAVASGYIVLVPSQPVSIGGVSQTGWLELTSDGTARGVLEDGDYGGFTEYAALSNALAVFRAVGFRAVQSFFVGFLAGFLVGVFVDIVVLEFQASLGGCPGNLYGCYKFSTSTQQAAATTFSLIYGFLADEFGKELCFEFSTPLLSNVCSYGFSLGLSAATNLFTLSGFLAAGGSLVGGPDPPLPPTLLIGSAAPAPTPSPSPGVTVSLTPDPNFSYPLGNAPLTTEDVQIPTVFDALITNTGPAADILNLSLLNPPQGFTLVGSLPTLQLPAGYQGEINVCAVPSGALPATGTQESFSVQATSTGNSGVTNTATATFAVPQIQGVALSVTQASATTTAGAAVQVSLQIQGAGNVATPVTLSLTSDPNLGVTGLQSSVTVNPGQTLTQTLTITPGPTAPLSSELLTTITATYGTNSTTSTGIALTVAAAQALPAQTGASDALAAGRSDIASTLSGLSQAISALVAGCTASTLASVQNYTQNLLQQISNTQFFLPAYYATSNAFSGIQSATCSSYTQPLSELDTFLASVNTLLTSPAAFPFQLAITPISVTAQPNSTSTFKLQLQNQSQVSQTYNLSVAGIPAGVGGLNTTSITLAPQQAVPAGLPSDPAVIIAETGTTLQSFSFTVSVAPTTLPTDVQTATATVNLRPDVLDVQNVTATPGFVNAGGSVDVKAQIANTVNQPTPVQATLKVLGTSNNVIAATGPVQTTLGDADLLAFIDFGQVTIPAGTPNGNLTLSVTVTDANGNPLTGGTGSGFLLVGSPVTANLTVSPTTVPEGTSTVLNSLTVTPTSAPPASLNLLGSVSTASTAITVALNGNTAYVCDENEVSVVDITNKSAPVVLTTALSGYITNASNIHCDIQQGDLVIFSDTSSTTTGNMPGFLVFGLSNPQSPNLLAAVPFNKRFVGDPIVYSGTNAFAFTNAVTSFFGSESNTYGDIVSVNVSNITNPQIQGTLSQNGDPVYGGPNEFYGQALYSPTILFGTATTLTGINSSGGAGLLDTIDISNTTNLVLSNQTTVSANGIQFLNSPLIQGNTLVALANTGATPNPEYVVVFDVANPLSPIVVSTTATGTFCCAGGGEAVLGPNQFLFAGTMSSATMGTPTVLLVDTTNPASPVITPISIPVAPNHLAIQGNYLYAPSASGLAIYSVPGTALNSLISGYTAIVQTANGGTANYSPSSFNVAPSRITPGTGFDTIEWDNPPVSTLTWMSTVTGIQAGQFATVDQGGTVSFTSTLGNGTVALNPADVSADQIISISPSTQTLGPNYYGYPGANYTLTLRNPTQASVTYNLTFAGITQAWLPVYPQTPFPTSVTVPALGTVALTLPLTPPLTLASGSYPFQVIANASGIYGAVGASLILNNPNPQQASTPGPGGLQQVATSILSLQGTPAVASVGRGGTAIFQLQMTNVGPVADTFSLTEYGYPAAGHITTTFANSSPTITPGQTYSDALSIQTPINAPVGAFPVTVSSSGITSGGYSQVQLMVNVIDTGVALSMNPSYSGISPGMPTQVTITNTGSTSDSYTLAVAGPAAPVVSLSGSSVTLAAGASQTFNVTIGNPTFAVSGYLAFSISAQSTTQPASNANVSSSIQVPYQLGITAAFQPTTQQVPASGNAVFPMAVTNVGSVEDGYTASISGTTGQVTATLTNLDGTTTQTIGDFQLPAQSTGQLNLNVTPTGSRGGTATVTITSLSSGATTAVATATLTPASGSTVLAPNASALTGVTVPNNRLAILNASASTDSNTPPLTLTYAWTLASKPAGSLLTTASIGFPTASIATFRPDTIGTYVFTVAVSNGTGSSTATATYTSADLPPVSVTNQPFNVATGSFALLDGSGSYDPDGQPLTFAWTLVSAPADSAITSASIHNAQTPEAFFTPDVAGAYQVQLIASDATASGNAEILTVTAFSGTVPPGANAGVGVNVGVGHQATLSGASSVDPNPSPATLNYQWTLASVPMGSSLTNASISGSTTATPSFTPDVAGSFAVSLVVSNAHGTSQPATVTVIAFSGNITPNANAGANQYITPGGTVTLSAEASNDPDNAPLPLAYLWWLDARPAGSTATLTHPLTATPQFVADTHGYYIARVEATDGLASGFANTLVTSAMTCDADANGVVNATDIALIQAALGQTALPNDPRDFDHNGVINASDVTGCSALIVTSPPTLQLSPASFTVTVTQGAAAQTQPIQVSSSGSAITFTVSSNQPWLTAGVASGSTASLNIVRAQVNPAGLTAGRYTGVLTFTPTSGTAQTVMATLVVNPVTVPPPPPPPATLTASPTQLTFTVAGCLSGASAQSLTIMTSGSGLNFAAQTNAGWLTVSPAAGSGGSSATASVSVNAVGLTAGTYAGSITFTATGATSAVVPVVLTVGSVNPLVLLPATLTLMASSGSSASANLSVNGACSAVAYTAQSDQSWLTLSSTGGQTPAQLAVTGNASNLPQGTYTAHVTITSPTVSNSPVVTPVTLNVGPSLPGARLVYAAVNSASFVAAAPVAPGSLVSIFGQSFTDKSYAAAAVPLPTSLGGVSVTMNSTLLPLLYVGPAQINAQMPYEAASGPVQLSLQSNGIEFASLTVQVSAVDPGLFMELDGSGRAAAENQDYSVNSPTSGARAGSYVIAFVTGLGAVTPAVADGAAAPLSPLSYAVTQVTATIGGQATQVAFAGLTPTLAGLAQVNVMVPNLAPGAYPIVIKAGGRVSNAGTITVVQ